MVNLLGRYDSPLLTAVIIFPMVAMVMAIPLLVHNYRRYGSMPLVRTVVVYSFMFYLLCAYFLVILPLPDVDKVAAYTWKPYNLIPFDYVAAFINESGFRIADPSTYKVLWTKMYLLEPLFNIVMMLPFGVYLRYYFKAGWRKVALLGFLLSLFFELTQLSGLYGAYPRAYRLFDVNDLMDNTTGALLGYALEPVLLRFLPDRDRLDEMAYQKGRRVTILRRLIAFSADVMFTIAIMALMYLVAKPPLWVMIVVPGAAYIVLPLVWDGRTLGKGLVRIRLADARGGHIKWYQAVAHAVFVDVWMGGVALLSMFCLPDGQGPANLMAVMMMAELASYALLTIDVISAKIDGRTRLWYEKLLATENVSTVVEPDQVQETASAAQN